MIKNYTDRDEEGPLIKIYWGNPKKVLCWEWFLEGAVITSNKLYVIYKRYKTILAYPANNNNISIIISYLERKEYKKRLRISGLTEVLIKDKKGFLISIYILFPFKPDN